MYSMKNVEDVDFEMIFFFKSKSELNQIIYFHASVEQFQTSKSD